jgi:hypothetical protein
VTNSATPADLSHSMLLAVLMHHGGSLDLPATAFEADALGGADGAFHAVRMDPLPGGTLRLSVVTGSGHSTTTADHP